MHKRLKKEEEKISGKHGAVFGSASELPPAKKQVQCIFEVEISMYPESGAKPFRDKW